MFEFTLLKSLFFELDKYKMDGITETKVKQSTKRRKEVHYPNVPSITSITAEERILPYLDRYYFYVNDETYPAELKEPAVKQVIYEFYKEHFPSYLKEGLNDDMTNQNILDCFEVFKMPDYRPKHAFPGLITLEDIRSGNVHDDDKPKYSFPGLEILGGRKKVEEAGEEKPVYADLGGYTAFDGDREGAKNKLEEMKKQFASQLKDLNADKYMLPETEESGKAAEEAEGEAGPSIEE